MAFSYVKGGTMVRWNARFGWISLAVWIVVTGILGFKCAETALIQEKGWLAGIFIAIVGLAVIVCAFVLLEERPKEGSHWRSWLLPKPLAGLYVGTFAAFSTMTGVLDQFAPSPAIEEKPLAIASTTAATFNEVKAIRKKLDSSPEPARVLGKIKRVWGPPGCDIKWNFRIIGNALVIDSVLAPTGEKPTHSVATLRPIAPNQEDVLFTDEHGRSAIFTYTTNGVNEGLRWDDQQTPPLDLVPC